MYCRMKKTCSYSGKPILIASDQFDLVLFRLLFPFEETEENLGLSAILPKMFSRRIEAFPTEESFQVEKLKRNILYIECSLTVVGTTSCIFFDLAVPRPLLLKEDLLEEAFELFEETIYHPYLEKGAFDSFDVEREVTNLKKRIQNKQLNLRDYLPQRISEIADDEQKLFSRSIDNHLEQLDCLTPQSLYQFYQTVIGKQKPISFVFGNIEETRVQELFQKYFKTTEEPITFIQDYYHFLSPVRESPQLVIEEKPFQQSGLILIYKIKDLKIEDRIPLTLIADLLASPSSNLLFQKLRTEKGLVYSVSVQNYFHYGVFYIASYIDADKMEEAKEGMLEVMEQLKDETLVTSLLDKIRERKRNGLERQKDNCYALFDDYIMDYLEINNSATKRYEMMQKVTAQDIHSLVDRFQLDTIYFVKEENHHGA